MKAAVQRATTASDTHHERLMRAGEQLRKELNRVRQVPAARYFAGQCCGARQQFAGLRWLRRALRATTRGRSLHYRSGAKGLRAHSDYELYLRDAHTGHARELPRTLVFTIIMMLALICIMRTWRTYYGLDHSHSRRDLHRPRDQRLPDRRNSDPSLLSAALQGGPLNGPSVRDRSRCCGRWRIPAVELSVPGVPPRMGRRRAGACADTGERRGVS